MSVRNHRRKHFSPKINVGTSLLSTIKDTLTNGLKTPILCFIAFPGLPQVFPKFLKDLSSQGHLWLQIPAPTVSILFCDHLSPISSSRRYTKIPSSGSAHPKPNRSQLSEMASCTKDSVGGRRAEQPGAFASTRSVLKNTPDPSPPGVFPQLIIPRWPQAQATGPSPPSLILSTLPTFLLEPPGSSSFSLFLQCRFQLPRIPLSTSFQTLWSQLSKRLSLMPSNLSERS